MLVSTVLEPSVETLSVAEPLLSVAGERLYRLSVEQYHAMIATGILPEEGAYELLDGLLVSKMGKKGPRCVTLDLLRGLLLRLLPPGWILRLQDPVTLDFGEPEPDAAVVRGAVRDFRERHPQPAQIAIVIEVADSTLMADRRLKQRMYARNEIPEFWLINLSRQRLEVYSDPDAEACAYRHVQEYNAEQSVPIVLDGQLIGSAPVSEVLS